jgi:hypothetical protein
MSQKNPVGFFTPEPKRVTFSTPRTAPLTEFVGSDRPPLTEAQQAFLREIQRTGPRVRAQRAAARRSRQVSSTRQITASIDATIARIRGIIGRPAFLKATENPNAKMPKYSRYSGYSRKSRLYGAYKHLAVYRNPFEQTTKQPQIPDGKAVESTGICIKNMVKVIIPTTGCDLVLFPGLMGHLLVAGEGTVVDGFPANPDGNFVCNGTDITKFLTQEVLWTQPTEKLEVRGQGGADAIHKWRCVSAGMHIQLLNNADQNEGYFEACRVGTPSDASDYAISYGEKNTANAIPRVSPIFLTDITTGEMINLPSHVDDTLRNVGRWVFALRPGGNDHDFIPMRQAFDFNGASNTGVKNLTTLPTGKITFTQEGDGALRFTNDVNETHDFIKTMVDPAYDSVLVKIHPRDASKGSTIIKVTTIMNVELIYDERSLNARFHSKGPYTKSFDATRKGRQNASSAAGSKNPKGSGKPP